MSSELKIMLTAIGVAAVLVGSLMYGADAAVERECEFYGEITGRPVVYHRFDSCYVRASDEWMRWDEYKAWVTAKSTKEVTP